MNALSADLGELDRRGTAALRALLIAATAAAGPVDPTDTTDLGCLAAAAPVALLGAAAAHHRVAGSVLAGVSGVDEVPDEVRDELSLEKADASIHHLVTIGALNDIASQFDTEGLTWLVMKGPAVAALLYPDVGDRRYGDLDLLVDRRDFPAAVRLLEDLGYQHSIKNWALAEEMLAGQISMSSPTLAIDLHWHLHYSADDRAPFAIDPDSMLARAERRSVSGAQVPVLDPVDSVVSLGFHAARSGGHRLIWMKDLERAVTVPDLDPDAVISRAHAFGCGPSVGLMLDRTRRYLGAPLPARLPRELASPALIAADRTACAIQHPVQFREQADISSALVRSVRRSTLASFGDAPGRTTRWARSRFSRPATNETDNPDEKLGYLTAVAASGTDR